MVVTPHSTMHHGVAKRMEVIVALLAAGADKTIKDNIGKTPNVYAKN